jgi:hypothetical protein
MSVGKKTFNFQPTIVSAQGLTSARLSLLQKFIEQVKDGEIMPFQEKTKRACENLKRAGLIK